MFGWTMLCYMYECVSGFFLSPMALSKISKKGPPTLDLCLSTFLFSRSKKVNHALSLIYRFPKNISEEYPFSDIKRSLQRWRRSFLPKNPSTLKHMTKTLTQEKNQRILQYERGQLSCTPVDDTDGQTHLIIWDKQLIADEFADIECLRLLIDATYQVTPKLQGVYQLLIIMIIKQDRVIQFCSIQYFILFNIF